MKHILLISFIIIISTNYSNALDKKDTIRVDYSFWGNSYFIDTNEYSKGDISDILAMNSASSDLISSSRTEKTLGYISLAGGLILTYSAIIDIYASYNNTGSSPNDKAFTFKIAGAIGLDLISIFLFSSSKSKFKRAIKSYNKFIIENSTTYNNEFNLNFTFNRIVLSYSF